MQSNIKMYCAWFSLEVGNSGMTWMSLSPCEYSQVQPTVFLLIFMDFLSKNTSKQSVCGTGCYCLADMVQSKVGSSSSTLMML